MNVRDPRYIASAKRHEDSLAALAAAGTPRYVAAKHPQKAGFTVLDRSHRESLGDDIEGVGWHWWPEPRVMPQATGWYKFRRDAEDRSEGLNAAEERDREVRREADASPNTDTAPDEEPDAPAPFRP